MNRPSDELLRVEGLCKYFPVVRGVFGKTVGHVRAVDDVSFTIRRGETLGLVGESGCGKTTAGRSILRLIEPSAGRVYFDGTDITALTQRQMRQYRRRMQIVFQDPFGSLNPRMRVVDIVGEAIERHGLARGAGVEAEVRELLRKVGLSPSWLNRYPHEFSGGQRQRIGVARAIAVSPDLIVCDEAVSALDVSIQAQVINLLIDLRREMNLAYLFIAHDLSVVRHISERVAVMYLGEIVEYAACAELFKQPAHPYTRALLSAIPVPDPRQRSRRVVLEGDVPTPLDPPSGCHFHPRCPSAVERCSEEPPPVVHLEEGRRQVRCVHAEGLEADPDWYHVVESRLAQVAAARARTLEREPPRVEVQRSVHLEAAPPSTLPAAMPALSTHVPDEPAPSRSAPIEQPGVTALEVGSSLAVLLGLGLVLFGSWGFGLLLVAVGSPGLVAAPPRALRAVLRQHAGLKIGACVVLVLVASRWVVSARRAAVAREQVGWLGAEVVAYGANVGKLPDALSDLRWRTVERFGTAQPRDPWGHPFRYIPQGDGRGFELSSNGPDGVSSADDITRTFESKGP
jgi:oligopeptide/dipeptide ABC transporter ATP-binding protein